MHAVQLRFTSKTAAKNIIIHHKAQFSLVQQFY